MRSAFIPGALLALILLAGCSPKVIVDPICPQTGFIGATDTVTELAADGKGVLATARLRGFTGECKFKDKKTNTVEVSLTLPFRAQRGAAGAALKQKEFSYFIGVLSPDEEILQRQVFTTKIDFDNETGAGKSDEDHVIKIPLDSRANADKYKVVIGFSLTREQFKYNETKQVTEPKK